MAIVYGLVCSHSNEAYIGVTSNMQKRFREHRCLLKNNKHHAKLLQNLWNKIYKEFGWVGGSFVMIELEIVENYKRGECCPAEQKWINIYHRMGLLLNANKTSQGLGGKITRKGIEASRLIKSDARWSAEANLKRSLAQKGKPKGHGAKISATKQAKKLMMI